MWSSGTGHSVTILPEATYEKNRYPSHVFWSRVSAHVSRLMSHALPLLSVIALSDITRIKQSVQRALDRKGGSDAHL